jgi:hypothetical protein
MVSRQGRQYGAEPDPQPGLRLGDKAPSSITSLANGDDQRLSGASLRSDHCRLRRIAFLSCHRGSTNPGRYLQVTRRTNPIAALTSFGDPMAPLASRYSAETLRTWAPGPQLVTSRVMSTRRRRTPLLRRGMPSCGSVPFWIVNTALGDELGHRGAPLGESILRSGWWRNPPPSDVPADV